MPIIRKSPCAGHSPSRSCRASSRANASSLPFAQRRLWLGQPNEALPLAQRAWELAQVERCEADLISAARLHGEAALGLGDRATADERLHHALTRAHTVNLVQAELPALTALAEFHRQRQQYGPACELLEQVWAPAERGPYPLWHADARNVLARIERGAKGSEAAIAAATRAYELAWCDGPPYAYHYGLTNAKRLLAELGAPEPQLPPFDESKFEPMPDVEINPKDEFWVIPTPNIRSSPVFPKLGWVGGPTTSKKAEIKGNGEPRSWENRATSETEDRLSFCLRPSSPWR